jgi:hypothetical protein
VCAAFTSNPGTACTSDANCTGCPATVDGLPARCCALNNPIGLHNGPRGIALAEDGSTLWVVNQFTTSISTVDVSPASPAAITVAATRSFPGAFGSDTAQRDRRLGQIEFFTDLKKSNIACATCHIDDHQDGVFFERTSPGRGSAECCPSAARATAAAPAGRAPPRPRRSPTSSCVERGGPICTPCTELGGSFFCFPSPEGPAP